MNSKRKKELSLLNVLFCIGVVFIHTISYAVTAFTPGTPAYNLFMLPWRIATVVVPGFVLLAGVKLFLNHKEEKPYRTYLAGRAKGILIPYAISYVVYYVYFMLFYDYKLDILFMLKHFLLGSLVFHLYFIPMLFQFDLLLPAWKKIVHRCSPLLVIPFALLLSQLFENCLPSMVNAIFPKLSFVYNDRLFTTYLGYWLVGCYIGKYYDAFCDMLKSNFKLLCILFAGSLLFMLGYSYLAYNAIAYIPYMNAIHGIYVMCALLFLFAVSRKIPERFYDKCKLLFFIDKWSLYIYLYHVLGLFFAEKALRLLLGLIR